MHKNKAIISKYNALAIVLLAHSTQSSGATLAENIGKHKARAVCVVLAAVSAASWLWIKNKWAPSLMDTYQKDFESARNLGLLLNSPSQESYRDQWEQKNNAINTRLNEHVSIIAPHVPKDWSMITGEIFLLNQAFDILECGGYGLEDSLQFGCLSSSIGTRYIAPAKQYVTKWLDNIASDTSDEIGQIAQKQKEALAKIPIQGPPATEQFKVSCLTTKEYIDSCITFAEAHGSSESNQSASQPNVTEQQKTAFAAVLKTVVSPSPNSKMKQTASNEVTFDAGDYNAIQNIIQDIEYDDIKQSLAFLASFIYKGSLAEDTHEIEKEQFVTGKNCLLACMLDTPRETSLQKSRDRLEYARALQKLSGRCALAFGSLSYLLFTCPGIPHGFLSLGMKGHTAG